MIACTRYTHTIHAHTSAHLCTIADHDARAHLNLIPLATETDSPRTMYLHLLLSCAHARSNWPG